MKRLSKEQILMLHSQLIEQTGGTVGVRDFNLLESAIETPFQVFGGEELYPTIQAKGTRLGYGSVTAVSNKMGGVGLYHSICRDCGSVVRSYVKEPEKLLKKKDRR